MKLKGLIVEDDISQSESMKILLERRGYSVETAESVSKALAKISEKNYSFGIVDLRLDEKMSSGLNVIKMFLKKYGDIPIFCISAYIDEIEVKDMPSSIFILSKPLMREDFMFIIDKLNLLKGTYAGFNC